MKRTFDAAGSTNVARFYIEVRTPTYRKYIHVFLGRSHKNTNNVFRLVSPVYNMNTGEPLTPTKPLKSSTCAAPAVSS